MVTVSVAAVGAAQFGLVALGVLAPELRSGFGLSRSDVGLLPSMVFLGCMVTSAPLGRLTDSRGAAPILRASLVVFAAALALCAAAPEKWFLMASVFVIGLAFGGVTPSTNAVVAGRISHRLGFFMGLKQTGVPLGGALAGAVLPTVAIHEGWRLALVLPIGCVLLTSLLAPLLRGANVMRPPRSASRAESRLRRRDLLALGSFGLVMAGSQWTFVSYLTLYIHDDLGMSLPLAGGVLAVSQAAGAVGRIVWGWACDLVNSRFVLVVLTVASLLPLLLLASGGGGAVAWLAATMAGFCLIGWNGAYYAVLADKVPPGSIGQVSGDTAVFLFTGVVVLPPLLGLVSDAFGGWRSLWLMEAAVLAVAIAAAWMTAKMPALRYRVAAAGGADGDGVVLQ